MHSGQLAPGEVLVVRPGQVLLFEHGQGTNGFLVRMAHDFLEGIAHRLLLSAGPAGIPISKEDAGELEDIAGKMENEISGHNAMQDEILRRYSEIFLIHLARSVKEMFRPSPRTRNHELTESFMSLLENHYREMKMVSDYAGLLTVTPNYLNEIVKKTTGQSAGHHIRHRIALEAKRHAVHSSLCMKEVAYALGFVDLGHFSKFFKSHTGRNFTDFKRDQVMFSHSATA